MADEAELLAFDIEKQEQHGIEVYKLDNSRVLYLPNKPNATINELHEIVKVVHTQATLNLKDNQPFNIVIDYTQNTESIKVETLLSLVKYPQIMQIHSLMEGGSLIICINGNPAPAFFAEAIATRMLGINSVRILNLDKLGALAFLNRQEYDVANKES